MAKKDKYRFHSVRRSFYDIEAEERFLDKCGSKMLDLRRVPFGGYCFEKTESQRYYAIEWLEEHPETDESIKHIEERCAEEMLSYIGFKNHFVYYSSSKPIKRSGDSDNAVSKRFRGIAIFWTVIFLLVAALLVYNIIWQGKFDDMNYYVKASSIEFFNGRNPATLFLYLIIPVTAILAGACVYLWTVFAVWRKRHGKPKKSKEAVISEELDI